MYCVYYFQNLLQFFVSSHCRVHARPTDTYCLTIAVIVEVKHPLTLYLSEKALYLNCSSMQLNTWMKYCMLLSKRNKSVCTPGQDTK